MEDLRYLALIAGFYFIVETVIVALVAKQFRVTGASVEKVSLAVVCAWALDMLISLPLLFVVTKDTLAHGVVQILTALIASTIVVKNIFALRWARAFLVAGVSALIFELVMALFWSFAGV